MLNSSLQEGQLVATIRVTLHIILALNLSHCSAGSVRYEALTAEEFAARNPGAQFDAVVASEVVEHVEDAALFVRTCCSLVREGGSVLVTTENRTALSYVAAIFVAERLLGLLPVGTHDWYVRL